MSRVSFLEVSSFSFAFLDNDNDSDNAKIQNATASRVAATMLAPLRSAQAMIIHDNNKYSIIINIQ